MLLERLRFRDRTASPLNETIDQARAEPGSSLSREALERVADSFPERREHRFVGEEQLPSWAPGRPEAAGPIGAALILAADHELNVSAFTARCVASANASPWDVVAAGLAALKGSRHGGHTERVEALFREAGTAAGARRVLADRLRRGEPIPGCGHSLYPDGDPRGTALLEMAKEIAPGSPAVECALAVAEAYRELIHEHPTIDHGLVALSRALDLPQHTPLALFALGRTIGWIGHAIEQYGANKLIRPRAAYVGEMPTIASPNDSGNRWFLICEDP